MDESIVSGPVVQINREVCNRSVHVTVHENARRVMEGTFVNEDHVQWTFRPSSESCEVVPAIESVAFELQCTTTPRRCIRARVLTRFVHDGDRHAADCQRIPLTVPPTWIVSPNAGIGSLSTVA